MKKHFLLFSLLIISIAIFAKPVDPTRAMQIAQEFVPKQHASGPGHKAPAAQLGEIVYTHYMPQSGKPAIYVINIGNAFAIVSADDVAHPILGYNYSKSWPTDGNIPPQVKSFFDDLAQQIEAAAEHPQDAETAEEWFNPRKAPRRAKVNDNLPDSVGPLLTTTWDQGQYYNALCPEDSQSPYDGHVLTGCVATAMAQIIAYWGKKETLKTRGTHSYNTDFYGGTYGELSVDFKNTTYDFTHIPDALSSTSTPQEVNAVAKLMYHCGVAVNMMYGITESGAFNQEARAAFINFFHISPDASFAERAYFTDDEWSHMLKADIASGKPVYYAGSNELGGGHAFVCNGYQKDGYFYFNFGWGGYADGWYLANAIVGYTSNQAAILGIEPDNNGNVILGQMQGTSTFIVDEPLEFYHIMGHNKYQGKSYNNLCNSTINFVSSDNSKQIVTDILDFEDQNITFYDGQNGYELRSLIAGQENNLSPVVSNTHKIKLTYYGNLYYAGYRFVLSHNSDYRMVSNVLTSLDTTTLHLQWTEKGSATQWEIEYGERGFVHGEGTSLVTNNTFADITFPKALTEYDIYIRSINGENQHSQWFGLTIKTEARYWQEIVTIQPESFKIDESTHDVLISCAEDFVWYINNYNLYANNRGYNVKFVADIDLGGYKWRPVDYELYEYGGNIDGCGHIIKNLSVIERNSTTALFSVAVCGQIMPSEMGGFVIKNLGLENANIQGRTSRTAGFCGYLSGNFSLENCFIRNSTIYGESTVGGMVAEHYGMLKNCYANVHIDGTRWVGLLVSSSQGSITNCYASGDIRIRSYCYYGGIAAGVQSGSMSHCYSIDLPMGVVGYKGSAVISDTSSFYKNSEIWTLRTPITFDGLTEDNLLFALNKGIEQLNDSTMKMWIPDADNRNNSLPLLGENYFVIKCPNVANLKVHNIKVNDMPAVVVDWEEQGDVTVWEIKYKPEDTSNESTTTLTVTSRPDTIYNLSLGRKYEFSVRSVCDNFSYGKWETITEMVDRVFWQDIVTEQPNGYIEDEYGNVTISSAEGLAWFSILVNGYHGNETKQYKGKTVSLTSDIDLAGYRWYPIGRYTDKTPYFNIVSFEGTFNGNGHTISGMYINSSGTRLGLFGCASDGSSFLNVHLREGLVNCYYNNEDVGGYGGLIGIGGDVKAIINCSSNVIVKGTQDVGALCGRLTSYSTDEYKCMIISNCYAYGDVYGRQSCGGLIGGAYNIIIQNCFATGNVYIQEGTSDSWYRGGLVGNLMSKSIVRNCFSTGDVERDNRSGYCGKVIGSRYRNSVAENVYGLLDSNLPLTSASLSMDIISDSSSFITNNEHHELLTPITIEGNTYDNLLDALNAWVAEQKDPSLKTWLADTYNVNGGYPIFGDNFEPSCHTPTNISITNATLIEDPIIRTHIEWEQKGSPSSWEILYVPAQQDINEGTIISVNSNPCILTNLPVGNWLDIYVRAVNSDYDKSGWSKYTRYIPDKLRWTEVVTSKPDGYIEDGNGNVYISSAEGLAWLSSIVNDLNGNHYNFDISNVYLMSDIDLSAYRWTSIGGIKNGFCSSVFDGCGHTVNGLYCNEYADNQGLFGAAYGSVIMNVFLNNCHIYGLNVNGIIVGNHYKSSMYNCAAKGEIYGIEHIGGLAGHGSYSASIYNSSFIGMVSTISTITLPNHYNGFIGGIIGSMENSIVSNSYISCETPSAMFSGIVVGSGGGSVNNIYAREYQTELGLTNLNIETSSSFFTSSGTSWNLNNPPYINGAFRTDLVDALNAWVDANNSEGIYRHWVADTENINGGFPIFDPNDNPIPTDINNISQQPIANSQKLIKDGQILIIRGDKTYTVTGQEVIVR